MNWPDNDKPVSVTDIIDPVLKAIRFAYNLERKNRSRSIPWNGLEIGEDAQANSSRAKERLKAHRLAYAEEDQGRDALEEIIGLTIQLGIEQGRRITMNSPAIETLKLELLLARLKTHEVTADEVVEAIRDADV